jgi:hypothetical protein
MRYPLLLRSSPSGNHPVPHDPESRAAEIAAVTASFISQFGRPPTPGTVEPLVDLPLSPETKAQLLYDIVTLVHLVVDPLLERRAIRSEPPASQIVVPPLISDYDIPEK